MLGSTSGSGHNERHWANFNQGDLSTAGIGGYTHYDWNDWCIGDCFDYCVFYDNDPCHRVETIGGGLATEISWAANTDNWECLFPGWTPGGRMGEYGMNLAVGSVVSQQTINITQIPKGEGNETVLQGDFWISSPVDDIAPLFLDDFNNRDSYKINGLDENVVPVVDKKYSSKNAHISITRMQGVINIKTAQDKPYKVDLFHADGRLIYSKSGYGNGEIRIAGLAKRGIYLAKVQSGVYKTFQRVITAK